MTSKILSERSKNINLIVSDLDGTLFRHGKTISRETIDVINRVRAKGIDFTVNTGRSFTWLGGFVDYLGIGCPLISANGSEITHGGTGERLFTARLSAESVGVCAE